MLKNTWKDMVDAVRGSIEEIGVPELEELRREAAEGRPDGPLVIDVREHDEWDAGRIPGAVHIPRGVLERDVAQKAFGGEVRREDLGRTIAIYCAGGWRSLLAGAALKRMGFTKPVSLAGGIKDWVEAGKEIEK